MLTWQGHSAQCIKAQQFRVVFAGYVARLLRCRYDTNDDGRIDQRELEQLCLDAGRDMTPEEVKAALKAIDEDGNGCGPHLPVPLFLSSAARSLNWCLCCVGGCMARAEAPV